MNGFCLGTVESRRKGGLVSQQKRRENPEFYRTLGCNVGNMFSFPEVSVELSEFVGIMLGDGGVTKYQLAITLNSEKDRRYADYVVVLVRKLFGVVASEYQKKKQKALVLSVSGVGLINFLIGKGLVAGNKVRCQIDVPEWIKGDREFSKWCVRGMIDTDGCVFLRRDGLGRDKYNYLNMYFSNKSRPLRKFVLMTLRSHGLHPKEYGCQVRLYSEAETRKYLELFGSSNRRIFGTIL